MVGFGGGGGGGDVVVVVVVDVVDVVLAESASGALYHAKSTLLQD